MIGADGTAVASGVDSIAMRSSATDCTWMVDWEDGKATLVFPTDVELVSAE